MQPPLGQLTYTSSTAFPLVSTTWPLKRRLGFLASGHGSGVGGGCSLRKDPAISPQDKFRVHTTSSATCTSLLAQPRLRRRLPARDKPASPRSTRLSSSKANTAVSFHLDCRKTTLQASVGTSCPSAKVLPPAESTMQRVLLPPSRASQCLLSWPRSKLSWPGSPPAPARKRTPRVKTSESWSSLWSSSRTRSRALPGPPRDQ
mmetsp:Transcript_41712/g.120878  ORF Transcript_41712/g.120878 Transcript_41712/m.120878 type:complete len:203 (-) Transcript_41712:4-612(-)